MHFRVGVGKVMKKVGLLYFALSVLLTPTHCTIASDYTMVDVPCNHVLVIHPDHFDAYWRINFREIHEEIEKPDWVQIVPKGANLFIVPKTLFQMLMLVGSNRRECHDHVFGNEFWVDDEHWRPINLANPDDHSIRISALRSPKLAHLEWANKDGNMEFAQRTNEGVFKRLCEEPNGDVAALVAVSLENLSLSATDSPAVNFSDEDYSRYVALETKVFALNVPFENEYVRLVNEFLAQERDPMCANYDDFIRVGLLAAARRRRPPCRSMADIIRVARKCIACEIEGGLQQRLVVYRSSTFSRDEESNETVSFSNGLFGGVLDDDGSAFRIWLTDPNQMFFMLGFLKEQLVGMFFPWFSEVASVAGHGEFDHSRIKAKSACVSICRDDFPVSIEREDWDYGAMSITNVRSNSYVLVFPGPDTMPFLHSISVEADAIIDGLRQDLLLMDEQCSDEAMEAILELLGPWFQVA
jgi:hypothetical protein